MRHGVKGRKLSRTASHRTATLRNLATSLLRSKKIKTTTAKAKELKTFVEPLITKAKNDTVASRRNVARHIKDKEVLRELFTEIVEKIGDRPGGYTRVIKLGNRLGDAAEMSMIELVDYNDVVEDKPKKKAQKPAKAKEVKDAVVVEETTVDKAEAEVVEKEVKTEEATEEVKAEEETPAEEVIETEAEKEEESSEEKKES